MVLRHLSVVYPCRVITYNGNLLVSGILWKYNPCQAVIYTSNMVGRSTDQTLIYSVLKKIAPSLQSNTLSMCKKQVCEQYDSSYVLKIMCQSS